MIYDTTEKIMDMLDRLVFAGGGGGIGNLGLVNENSCFWHGWATRSCCIAQGTIYQITCNGAVWKIVWEKEWMYMYDWVTLLYSRNWQNIINNNKN